jgi:phosphotransferase system enzyme I (PtsI)
VRKFSGIGASSGLVLGKALVFRKLSLSEGMRRCEAAEVASELAKLEEALVKTRRELEELRSQLHGHLGEGHARILDAQLLLLEDEEVLAVTRSFIREELLSAASAFARAIGEALVPLHFSGETLFRERIEDFRDVEQRVLRALRGGEDILPQLTEPVIIVANQLSPSDTASLEPEFVLGFCIDEGGPSSHTAIIARSLGVACVVGMGSMSRQVDTGDELIVDGLSGQVIVSPEEHVRERFAARVKRRRKAEEKLNSIRALPAVTPDGHSVELAANVELPVEISLAIQNGAEGIGLLRTEFFYFRQGQIPAEDEQFEAYREVIQRAQGKPVIFRVLDVGGDKLLTAMGGYREYNPFLGWRGVRYLLSNPDLLRTQLRALYRVSALGPMKIMVPMITDVSELRKVHAIARSCRDELVSEGVSIADEVQIGIMVETPSAVAMASELARECDFFSIGTNDLTQYIMAVDRTNSRVAYLHRPSHPAVLRAVKQTIDSAHEARIWVGLCGEMGGNPSLAILLMGMGIDEISTNAATVPVVKKAIRSVRFSSAQAWAQQALAFSTSDEVEHFLRVKTQRSLRDLLQEHQAEAKDPAEGQA